MSGARVLVVDDDPAILRAVKRALEARGYAVSGVATAARVLPAVRDSRPAVVLLDLVLPDGDGIQLCRQLRRESALPIIVLSAIGDDRKKVQALDEGADDYLTKPFSMEELLARVRVALRHAAGLRAGALLTAGPVAIDVERHTVTVAGEPVHLTPREFDLCRLLVQGAGRLVTQRQALAAVWGAEYVDDTHILRTFVHQLRLKLGPAGALIENDPGVGYRFAALRE
jgi:two-component system KDP operon response regulator KdpE